MTETDLYGAASVLARNAMGRGPQNPGKGRRRHWLAEEDPMAWWCLTEAIVGIAQRYAANTVLQEKT